MMSSTMNSWFGISRTLMSLSRSACGQYRNLKTIKRNELILSQLRTKSSMLSQHSSTLSNVRHLSSTQNVFHIHNTRHYCSNDSTSSTSSSQKLAKVSPHLGIMYTCKVCGSRNSHSFSRNSYEKGVVIVQCSGCKNNHLIADNLGWFNDIKERNIEEILESKGEAVQKMMDIEIPREILAQFQKQVGKAEEELETKQKLDKDDDINTK